MNEQAKNKKVFVAVSGGVDSSVALLLLKEQGYDVTGVFMKNWSDPAWPCPWQEDRADAMRVAVKLGIHFETFDFTKEYKALVVDYMIREYALGRTPNPDVMCNKEIKFGLFFDKAVSLGADYIATGHYARIYKASSFNSDANLRIHALALRSSEGAKDGNDTNEFGSFGCNSDFSCRLYRARDLNKDQSYFLWTLKQSQLSKCLFPIGEIKSKAKVREIARQAGLPTADKKDSQGICFMGPVDIQEFIKPFVKSDVGDIVTTDGVKIGTHSGLDFYTIGQRKGIGVGGTGPYYVARKDYKSNTLIVAPVYDMSALDSKTLIASDVSFVSDEQPTSLLKIQAAVRYRQKPAPAKLEQMANGKWRVVFDNPVRAVTPGQSAVFYDGEELLGGGVIDKSD